MIARLLGLKVAAQPKPAEPLNPYKELFRTLPILRSDRLVLRPLEMIDVVDLYEMDSDEEICKLSLATHLQNVLEAERIIQQYIRWRADGYATPWAVTLAESGQFIGTCGVTEALLSQQTLRMGFSYVRSSWNQGYGTEALRCLIEFLFETTSINRLECHCFPDNTPSRRVMEKSGMVFEGVLRQAMSTQYGLYDCCVYSILRSDWEA